jgi:hypothetical protein
VLTYDGIRSARSSVPSAHRSCLTLYATLFIVWKHILSLSAAILQRYRAGCRNDGVSLLHSSPAKVNTIAAFKPDQLPSPRYSSPYSNPISARLLGKIVLRCRNSLATFTRTETRGLSKSVSCLTEKRSLAIRLQGGDFCALSPFNQESHFTVKLQNNAILAIPLAKTGVSTGRPFERKQNYHFAPFFERIRGPTVRFKN